MTAPSSIYRGRFAPSPTGPLHFGSLVTAVASYLQAKTNNGEWLVRIEDIDPPREIGGAAQSILTSLDTHGFAWDKSLELWQSSRLSNYRRVTQALLDDGHAYVCTCSRQQLKRTAASGPHGIIYPGTCRDAGHPYTDTASIRLITDEHPVSLHDQIQGDSSANLSAESGDFLIRRGDGLVAYQLAVTVDDAHQEITEVVRGIDLLPSTYFQIHLQHVLGSTTPDYAHIPIVVDASGHKLSKQNGAKALDPDNPELNILRALHFLEQSPPKSLSHATLNEIWGWALENWQISSLRSITEKPEIGHFP